MKISSKMNCIEIQAGEERRGNENAIFPLFVDDVHDQNSTTNDTFR